MPCLRIDKPLTSVEALDLLINLKPGDKHVCSKKPVAVKNAATFVVDTGKLGNVEDLKADEMGAWCHKGKPTRKFISIKQEVFYMFKVRGKFVEIELKSTMLNDTNNVHLD